MIETNASTPNAAEQAHAANDAQMHSKQHQASDAQSAQASETLTAHVASDEQTRSKPCKTSDARNESAAQVPSASAAAQAPATQALLREIEQLKEQRNAVILAHYYVPAEVQDAADYVGDSFALAKLAVDLPQQTIVLCGVEFMGESAKLLNPGKTVLLPEPSADCPMAHMIRKTDIDRVREQYGSDLAVVCYVNSTAEAKTWSDVCVTSSNAVNICSKLPQHNLLFIPDMNLGRYVAEQLPEKHVILNKGYCPRHMAISANQVIDLEESYPDAVVMAHPECPADVLAEADFIGSTKGMIEHAAASNAQEFIVCTVAGILRELERRCANTDKRFYFPTPKPRCENMDLVTLPKVAACLRNPKPYEVHVNSQLAPAARVTLERMLEYAAK